MKLKPWHKVVRPREDLAGGRSLEASEFAINLDQVVYGRAPKDYQDPARLFSKTHLTKGLIELMSEVERRLAGETLGTSPVITLSTQFGGGKTHALTLLYHLALLGPDARALNGVNDFLRLSGIAEIPKPVVGVFVGSDFDSVKGRSKEGEPTRKTPWGDLAWQIGGSEGFKIIEEHDMKGIAPGKEIIREILRKHKAVLILMDEVLSYMSRARWHSDSVQSTLASQFYEFLRNLSEEISSNNNMSLVMSLPKSEREMNFEDEHDLARLQKLASRVGKAYLLSEGLEIAEIIRTRLFIDLGSLEDRKAVADAYAKWVMNNRISLPNWFQPDNAKKTFESTYPFHPITLSVFERKWQALPQFQRTRGVLKMLALWLSNAYKDASKNLGNEFLISIGSAPFEDRLFRAEVFDELGKNLEEAVMSDIAGQNAFATALDEHATEEIKKDRLHRKVSASIFFESSGGQVRPYATEPEIRLSVGQPGLNIANIETVLKSLTDECYYLRGDLSGYWIDLSPNLNRLFADRSANIPDKLITESMEEKISDIFGGYQDEFVKMIFFPKNSREIPNVAKLIIVILHPDYAISEKVTKIIQEMTSEYGDSGRTFKSALIWCVIDKPDELTLAARKFLAWKQLNNELTILRIDSEQRERLRKELNGSERNFKVSVSRAYRNILFLDKNNNIIRKTLDQAFTSTSESPVNLILTQLQDDDILTEYVTPRILTKYWPQTLSEWSTKSLRDELFSSPKFPRVRDPNSIKRTIAEGVTEGEFGYAHKASNGSYQNILFGRDDELHEIKVEISDDVVILPQKTAELLKKGMTVCEEEIKPVIEEDKKIKFIPAETVDRLVWEGDIDPQLWMDIYTNVLSRFQMGNLRIKLKVEVQEPNGIPTNKIAEMRRALKELGLSDDVRTES